MLTEIKTLGTSLPEEIQRVQELIPQYEAIGPAGQFAIAMMKADIAAAHKAMIAGDTVEMIRVYQSLKGFNL